MRTSTYIQNILGINRNMLDSVYLLPHGMQIISGVEETYNQKFKQLDSGMKQMADFFSSRNIDTVVFVTPHGYSLPTSYAIYNHSRFQGFVYQLEEGSVVYGTPFRLLEIKGDLGLAKQLYNTLENEIDVEILTHGSPDYPITLNWGAIVPINYIVSEADPSFVFAGIPRSRHTDLAASVSQGRTFIQKLSDLVDTVDQNIAIVISGDLSHKHLEDGPYGYHKDSEAFDRIVQEWTEDLEEEQMDRILDMQSTAIACGMVGMTMLQQLSHRYNFNLINRVYAKPTYFGMIIAYYTTSIK